MTICFMLQLKMFEDMGFKVDHDSAIYKKFHLNILGGISVYLALLLLSSTLLHR